MCQCWPQSFTGINPSNPHSNPRWILLLFIIPHFIDEEREGLEKLGGLWVSGRERMDLNSSLAPKAVILTSTADCS